MTHPPRKCSGGVAGYCGKPATVVCTEPPRPLECTQMELGAGGPAEHAVLRLVWCQHFVAELARCEHKDTFVEVLRAGRLLSTDPGVDVGDESVPERLGRSAVGRLGRLGAPGESA